MEASGHARWFERLVAELQFDLWIGDAAAIRAKRVRKQKTAYEISPRDWSSDVCSSDLLVFCDCNQTPKFSSFVKEEQ